MAKLYFRHGAVGSAKSLNLLAVAHSYRQQKKKVVLIKPEMDLRFGASKIRSRAGLEKNADLLVSSHTLLDPSGFQGVACVLVDEAQFLSAQFIDQLRELTLGKDIPVICYGLRTDFRSNLFDGARRLLEVADTIEEIKTTCTFCNKKAIMNLKHVNGLATIEGPSIDLGTEEKYYPTCYRCYRDQLKSSGNPNISICERQLTLLSD